MKKPTKPGRHESGKNMMHKKAKSGKSRRKTDVPLDYDENSDYRTSEVINRILHLQSLIDVFAQKTEKGKVDLADLQKQVDTLELEHKTKLVGATATSLENSRKESERVMQKIFCSLENKLDKMKQEKGAEEQKQRHLKDEIDCIRVERRGLAEVYGGFHNELGKNKKKLRSIMVIVNDAQLTRLATEEHILTLKRQMANTEQRFENDWRQLNTVIQKERQQSEALVANEKKALSLHWDRRETLKRVEKRDKKLEIAKKKAEEQTRRTMKEKRQFEEAKDRAIQFEKRIVQIKQELNLTGMAGLAERFVQKENTIFELLKQTNELTEEAETWEHEVRDRQKELQKVSGETESRSKKHQQFSRELDEREKAVLEKSKALKEKAKLNSKIMKEFQANLQHVFKSFDCGEQIPSARGLQDREFTESTTLTYIGVVQERINQLLTMFEHVNTPQFSVASSSNVDAASNDNPGLLTSNRAPITPKQLDKTTRVKFSNLQKLNAQIQQDIENNEPGRYSRHQPTPIKPSTIRKLLQDSNSMENSLTSSTESMAVGNTKYSPKRVYGSPAKPLPGVSPEHPSPTDSVPNAAPLAGIESGPSPGAVPGSDEESKIEPKLQAAASPKQTDILMSLSLSL